MHLKHGSHDIIFTTFSDYNPFKGFNMFLNRFVWQLATGIKPNLVFCRSEYDRGPNTFSPEGRLFQVLDSVYLQCTVYICIPQCIFAMQCIFAFHSVYLHCTVYICNAQCIFALHSVDLQCTV